MNTQNNTTKKAEGKPESKAGGSTMNRPEVSISRDSFARGNLMRRRAEGECAWCGQPARFQYGWNDDARGRTQYNQRVFCSISCKRDYES